MLPITATSYKDLTLNDQVLHIDTTKGKHPLEAADVYNERPETWAIRSAYGRAHQDRLID